MRRNPWFASLLLVAVGLASLPVSSVGARGLQAADRPSQLVREYFANLNGHRFHAAWLLEAPCNVSWTASNGPGAPTGSGGLAGKSTWKAPTGRYAAHPILASVLVTGIRQLSIPELGRAHILAFGVSGWFRFDYSAVASQPSYNNKHRSGFHEVKIALWKCAGRWGIEPSYWLVAGGGPLDWT